MTRYDLRITEEFERKFLKLPNEIQRRYMKQIVKVEESPFSVGKPLGAQFLRELKNKAHRVYYAIFDEDLIVLFAAVSGKKDQKLVIAKIRENLPLLRPYLKSLRKFYKPGEQRVSTHGQRD